MGPHRHLRNFLQTALRRDLNAMIDAGWDEGRAEGIAVGKVEGIALGRAEGKAELLEPLLEKKFGLLSDSIRTRLFAASDGMPGTRSRRAKRALGWEKERRE